MAQISDASAWPPPADNVQGMFDAVLLVRDLSTKLKNGQPIDNDLETLRCMLQWLEGPIVITPLMRQRTEIGRGLLGLFKPRNPALPFPADIAERAKALHDRFSATGWGNPAAGRSGEVDGPYKRLVGITTFAQDVELPPATHPIYGELGIMYGSRIDNAKGTFKQAQRPDLQPKPCSVIGHNDLLVGTWFPNRLLARIHGAHGEYQAGISGSKTDGAYSIVLSADYTDLDRDEGNVIYYSAPSGHTNTDPDAISGSTQGAKRLHKSIETKKPVRVLRSSTAANTARPSCGIRYDGLYLVTGVETTLNPKGGQYEQFRLERLGNQLALEDIVTPTSRQVADFNRIKEYYGSFRR